MKEYMYNLISKDNGGIKLVRWEDIARYNSMNLEHYLVYNAYKNYAGMYCDSDTVLLSSFKYKTVKEGIELEIKNMIDMESKMPTRYNFSMYPYINMNSYPFSIEEFNKVSNGEIYIDIIEDNINFIITKKALSIMFNNIANGKSYLEYSIALKRLRK